MDALPSPPELTSDIQRAIQQAVGQANNAFIRHQVINQSRSAKRKRTKEKATTEETEENHKKKKAVGHASSQASTSASAAEQPATHSKSRKTSLKQGSKTVADVGSANEPSSNPPSLSQSPAAFLDAVVSAASATAAPSDTSYGFSQPCFDTPLSPSYPFSPVAGGLTLNTAAFQPPISFTNPAVSGLEYASSDDILHALQELDVSKIASVLKTLGEAAAAANIPLASLSSTLLQRPQPVTPIDPAPSNPTVISESTTQRVSQHHRRFVDMTTHHESLEHSDHAELLATKWLSANKLAELARTQGLVYKKGKFSAIEEQQLSDAIQAYKEVGQVICFLDLVFAKNGAAKNNAFWDNLSDTSVAAAVPMRPIIAIYHHVRRTYHPLRAQGKWMPSEDALLKAAVQELGQQWEKVSDRVGRMASDCRDRYRNHIQNSEDRAVGPWTKDEEMRLTQIVTDMTVKQGKDINNEVFWGVVSERMGNRRGRQQCRIKWTDSLSKTFKNNGTKPRWSSRDAYILVHKVDSLHVRDDSEVDWKTLPDPNWNLWSAHTLQRRWLTMKRSVRGHEDMTHAEILDILRLKKLHLPGSRSRAVVSAEAVEIPMM
ncbi:hypothetical protein B0F90DRAFT_1686511 [Multifurca ochricompacta]|uniref:Uncharacterized protein n=1 Tax=Multifurca ochricompacta TaxID=376703 RepID=A0AAD4MBT8_9AGAM|nr:hypothetical protein B0F90DRAFT_1686511 [Multifurca ochricompacta]